MALGLAYLRAIEAAGGLPLVIPPMPSEAVKPLVERLHGVCLSGGPGPPPAQLRGGSARRAGAHRAGARPLRARAGARGARTQPADSRDLPRGAALQRGDGRHAGPAPARRPPTAPSSTARRPPPSRSRTRVELAAASATAARARGPETWWSTPSTTRPIDRLGRGLLAVGWSPDGVVEAIEAPGRDFVLGVQWHAECLVERPEQMRLFTEPGRGVAALRLAAGGPGRMTLPSWARGRPRAPRTDYTLGVEEEIMLLDPAGLVARAGDRPGAAGARAGARVARDGRDPQVGAGAALAGAQGRARRRAAELEDLRAAPSRRSSARWACAPRRAAPIRSRSGRRRACPPARATSTCTTRCASSRAGSRPSRSTCTWAWPRRTPRSS